MGPSGKQQQKNFGISAAIRAYSLARCGIQCDQHIGGTGQNYSFSVLLSSSCHRAPKNKFSCHACRHT